MSRVFSKLTRPEMRKLLPGGRITEQGITFERLPNGDGRFTVNVMVDGQRIHRVVGRESDGTTRTQAEEFMDKARNDAKHDRLSLPKGRKVQESFRAVATKYEDRLREEGGKDLKAKGRRLAQHLIPFFGDRPLSAVTTSEVERYKEHRVRELAIRGGEKQRPKDASKLHSTKASTVNRELAVLSHLFNKAMEWGWTDRRPVIRRFKEDDPRLVYLTAEQIVRLVESAQADDNPQILTFIMIGLDTAMRSAEILSIRAEHVDLERLQVAIPHAKAGARSQPITPRLVEFLRPLLASLDSETPWLFPSAAAKAGRTVTIRKAFRRVVEAAGLDPEQVTPHCLRHTAITHLVQAGVDLPTVARISGHRTLRMVAQYAHANGDHIQAAMDKLQRRIAYRLPAEPTLSVRTRLHQNYTSPVVEADAAQRKVLKKKVGRGRIELPTQGFSVPCSTN